MEMTKEQLELITNQLATIKERSPFYAKKFEGIDVADVRTQADFEKLPFLICMNTGFPWKLPAVLT